MFDLKFIFFAGNGFFRQGKEKIAVSGKLFFCAGEVMASVIAAFDFFGAGNGAHGKSSIDGVYQASERVPNARIHGKQIKSRAAAHRPEIDNIFLIFAVSQSGREHVLDRMQGGRRNVVAAVGFFETQIECRDALAAAGKVEPGQKAVMIFLKRGDLIHGISP